MKIESKKWLDIAKAINLLNNLKLDVNKESIAFICAVKRMGRETERKVYITVDDKVLNINNICCLYLIDRLNRLNDIHTLLKDLTLFVYGDTFRNNCLEVFKDEMFYKIFHFPESSKWIMKKIFLNYYKEYLLEDEQEQDLILGDCLISDEFINLFKKFRCEQKR
ncbi:MAG: hypothetical protein ACLRYM_06140 [Thomasclavelia ramosa]